MTQRHEFTERKQKLFLEGLARTGVVLKACRMAHISRTAVYAHRNADKQFQAAWDQADEEFTELLEAKAHSLAFEGKETSLWNLLKARKPDRYRDPIQRVARTDSKGNDVTDDSDANLLATAARIVLARTGSTEATGEE